MGTRDSSFYRECGNGALRVPFFLPPCHLPVTEDKYTHIVSAPNIGDKYFMDRDWKDFRELCKRFGKEILKILYDST